MNNLKLADYRKFIEVFTKNLLAPYLQEVKSRGAFEPKEVNDPVWQTISFFPFEVVFIDSPLLQRLRQIRQLGVVHWVYPGAVHTRFEHSLGAVHQIQCLAASLNSRASAPTIIEPQWVNFLRLAALCHDVGHGLMSHVSENAFAGVKEMEDLTMEFADQHQLERVKPSEMAAVYMFGSPAFQKLVAAAEVLHPKHEMPPKVPDLLKRIVIGLPVCDRLPLLQEFISGPFDADKLDYMMRDSKMTGVPGVTDVSRIIQKVRSREVAKRDLPREIAARVGGHHPSYIMTGIALSGGRSLDELMLGRALLFDKVYRHQKVRAAEHMVAAMLRSLSEGLDAPMPCIPYQVNDDALQHMTDALLNEAQATKDRSRREALRVASDLGKRLRERRLFVRAFAFAQVMTKDAYRTDPIQKEGMERLLRDCSMGSASRRELAARIADASTEALRLLGDAKRVTKLPGGSLLPYIAISPPESPAVGNDIMRAYLLSPDGSFVKFKEDSAETRGWADAYLLSNDVGYVFTLKEFAPVVYLAAERHLRSAPYNVRIPATMMSYAKQSEEEIAELRRTLCKRGFYEGCPSDLKPEPERLARADVDVLVDGIVTTAGRYDGIKPEVEPGSAALAPGAWRERVLDWCAQFEDESMVDAALRVLGQVTMVGRTEILSALESLFTLDASFRKAAICALGDPKDSGNVVTYYSGDIARTAEVEIMGVQHGVDEARPLVFVDDFLGSGRQAVSIMESLLGLPLTYDLGETRRTKLSRGQTEELRKKSIGFVFSAGLDEGVKTLESFIKNEKLNGKVVLGKRESAMPTALKEDLYYDAKQSRAFWALCRQLGKSLLVDGSPKHNAAWARDKLLGYGNRGLLVIFPYNTPSQTLTCLWAGGHALGRPWTPLFPRRKKE